MYVVHVLSVVGDFPLDTSAYGGPVTRQSPAGHLISARRDARCLVSSDTRSRSTLTDGGPGVTDDGGVKSVGLMTTGEIPSKRSVEERGSTITSRHPVLVYGLTAFAISWSGVLVAVRSGSLPAAPEEVEALLPAAIVAMLAGPPIAGLLLIMLRRGRAGVRRALSELLVWRVGLRWYAFATLTAPLASILVRVALSAMSPDENTGGPSSPHPGVAFAIATALGAGLFEEIGWTAFATTELRRRLSVLGAGVRLGFVWGAWHLLVGFWSSRTYTGDVPVPMFLGIGLFTTLFVYRVLMVWVYDRTRSLGIAVLMHASLTACSLLIQPHTSGIRLLSYDVTLAAVLWVVVITSAWNGSFSLRSASRYA